MVLTDETDGYIFTEERQNELIKVMIRLLQNGHRELLVLWHLYNQFAGFPAYLVGELFADNAVHFQIDDNFAPSFRQARTSTDLEGLIEYWSGIFRGDAWS
jgi:hypothetical protein